MCVFYTFSCQVCEEFKMLAPCGVQVYCIYGGARYEPQVCKVR